MGKLERITVTMPEEMAAKLREAVESGKYATTSEIVREALRGWNEHQERQQAALEKLRELIDEGLQGPSLPAEEVFADLRSYVARLVAEHDADAA